MNWSKRSETGPSGVTSRYLVSKDNIDAMTKSLGVMPKTVQAIATKMADYSKRASH
jgi:hypothetical protein